MPTTLIRVLAPLVVALALFFGGYYNGKAVADRSAEFKTLRDAYAEMSLERDIEKAARVADAAIAATQAKQIDALTNKTTDLQEYANALEDAGRECLAGPDADRLRDLWD